MEGGGRRKGRPKRRWMDSVYVDLREGTVRGGGDAKPGDAEATGHKYRPDVAMGKDAVEEEASK